METLCIEPYDFTEQEKQQFVDETQRLVEKLELAAEHKNRKGAARKSTHLVYNSPSRVELTSWKFQEWDYGRTNVTLPTQARGLFTMFDEKSQLYKIVVRGYDKFFNLDEMNTVSRKSLLKKTQGPYSLSVKSNGCILLISGLEDGTLVVCSKHATGVVNETNSTTTNEGKVSVRKKNHALAGQTFLEAQLAKQGIESKELALTLFKLNVTAVAEYCDDEFEEHILEYTGDKSGLYLHGLNLNTPDFMTYPLDQVALFAEKYGFKKTEFIKFHTLEESFGFLDECAKTGKYNGEEIEGFVIRCKRNSQDYLFKYKFEEPYLLYRQLREVTKTYITHGYNSIQFGAHKLVCIDYLKVVIPILEANPELKEKFMDNLYVIELRKKYFEIREKSPISVIEEEEGLNSLEKGGGEQTKYILVPVATIGCGKTTTALTLLNLYPQWGHIQNDNIPTPTKNKLVAKGLESLITSRLVILDKNNHMFRERKQIFQDLDDLNTLISRDRLKVICLNFVSNSYDQKLWDITVNRVMARGDNHQSIKAASDGTNVTGGIMKGFINRFQPVVSSKYPDDQFARIIDLDVSQEDSSYHNAKKILEVLQEMDPKLVGRMPTDEEIKEAYEKACNYTPTFSKIMPTNKKQKSLKPQYFGVDLPKEELVSYLENEFTNSTKPSDFWDFLKCEDRIQPSFHITLFHSFSKKDLKELWNKYLKEYFVDDLAAIAEKYKNKPAPVNTKAYLPSGTYADIEADAVYWNSEIMCVSISKLEVYRKNGDILKLRTGNKFLHVTIGRESNTIKAKESNTLLENLLGFGGNLDKNCAKYDAEYISFKKPLKMNNLPLFAYL